MFLKAKPIWIYEKENEMNIQAKFVAEINTSKNLLLKICGATFYKVYANGNLIHMGPAPAAKGYARVDVLTIPDFSADKCNIVIEAAGYNCYSYSSIKQTSFVQAEILSGGECIAATGYDFLGYHVTAREQKTIRYSFQRQFTEVWNLLRPDIKTDVKVLNLDLKYLNRKAPNPDIRKEFITVCSKGNYELTDKNIEIPSMQGATDKIGDAINGFKLEEIDTEYIKDFYAFDYSVADKQNNLPCMLKKGEYAVFECSKCTTGLIGLKYKASEDCKIYVAFDEKLTDGKFSLNTDRINLIEINSEGATDFESFEIYGFKYFGVFVADGDIEISCAGVTKIRGSIENPPKLNCTDDEILKIYEAVCESAKCNSLATFTDCPSRERAAWLCDSFFTSQGVYQLCGNTDIEDDFIENFLYADGEFLPEGMIPMCYPADHPNGNYIPQWALWFILQLDGYKERNKNTNINDYKGLAYNLLSYFSKYENEFGLLEDVGGWSLISYCPDMYRCASWTSGISFPANMLYQFAVRTVGKWYKDERLLSKAENIKKQIIKMSFDGTFFRDQATRNDENLPVCNENISEACQYYAFFCGVTDGEKFSNLKQILVNDFAYGSRKYKNVERSDIYVGICMRMKLLKEWGFDDKVVSEIKSNFGYMAYETGTLWEHTSGDFSLNHGFNSYLSVILCDIFNR